MGGYVKGVFTGVVGCGLATGVDHLCRKLYQVQLTPTVRTGLTDAVIEELIYSVCLQPDKALISRWNSYIFIFMRAVSALITGSTAARTICYLKNYSLAAGGGLSLDNKVGLLWVVCRECTLWLLPARLAAHSLGIADSVVLGLAELYPVLDKQPPLSIQKNMILHKACTAVAFRLIAGLSTQYGNLSSPFVQHILFNYLIFRESISKPIFQVVRV